ncbi:MAG: methylmalonyl-CoA epimerase [bacterium]|nr:methylmalonyl-CoA epimerase [bacterium]
MKRIDHIAIAVSDLDAAEKIYRDVLNLHWEGREEVPLQKVITSLFQVGESRIELLQPTAPDSPISAFLEKKGPGLHHIALEVDDVEAKMARLKAQGIRLLNDQPADGVGGSKIVFLHPKDTGGVLVELVEKPSY